jgi:hypothetical protein
MAVGAMQACSLSPLQPLQPLSPARQRGLVVSSSIVAFITEVTLCTSHCDGLVAAHRMPSSKVYCPPMGCPLLTTRRREPASATVSWDVGTVHYWPT